MKNEKKPYHVTVAEKIIEQLESGTAPWQKPWKAGNDNSFLPYNPVSGNRYKGINTLHLLTQGKEDRRWLTYNQAKNLGAQVRTKEKGTTVQYWKFSEERIKRDKETGKPILDKEGKVQKETVKLERPKVFYASVFNAEQIDNMPQPPINNKKEQEWEPLERAESLLKASGASISHSQNNNAFYRSSTDEIHMPRKDLFDSADKYYATALHELGHWTGHETRLDRPLNNPFGSEAYAKEELRAEISSMILGEELQIGHDPEQHTAYVKSWVKVLKEDPLEIFRAAADAEKINTFVLALEQNLTIEQSKNIVDQPKDIEKSPFIKLGEAATKLRNETNSNDYNPLTSYVNLVKTAESLGFETVLKPKSMDSDYESLQIEYKRGDTVYPVQTELLLTDGKALTSFNNERISGTSYTAEDTWQSDALHRGLLLAEQEILINDPNHIDSITTDLVNKSKHVFDSLGSANFEMNAIESSINSIPFDEETKVKLPILTSGLDLFGHLIDELSKSVGDIVVLTDEQIKETLPAETVAIWDEIKEQAFFKSAIPLLTINNKTNESEISFQPSNIFSGLKCVIEDDKVNTQFNGVNTENLEEGLNAALLHSLHQESEEDEIIANKIENSVEKKVKHYLDIPYKEKDEAKKLGAEWDKEQKSWYAPANFPLEQFSKWDKNDGQVKPKSDNKTTNKQAENTSEKIFLAVPYADRKKAKAAGAKWDLEQKSWYADNSSNMDELNKFVSDKGIAQEPALSPREEFADLLKSMNAIVSDDHPIMDGKKQRIECEGDKKGEKSGFYIAHLDGHPAGYFTNNRTGKEEKWKSKGYSLSDEDKAILNAESAKKTQKRDQEKQEEYKKVSEDVTAFFIASPTVTDHQYLKDKNVSGEELKVASTETLKHLAEDSRIKIAKSFTEAKSLREDNKDNIVFIEGDLLVPAKDKNNKIWSIQSIQTNGRKSFAKGGKKTDNYCVVGKNSLETADIIIIGEGYSTAKSVDKITTSANAATVVSFDSGNLVKVAKQLRKDYPDKPIIIAGEDDKKAELKPPFFKNVGKDKAKEAAEAVKGVAIFPTFAQGEAEKGLSDFNDLENKSSLGSIAVDRQLRAAINKVVEQNINKPKLIKNQSKTQSMETPKRKVSSR